MATLSKHNQNVMGTARVGRGLSGDGYYARLVSSAFRCSSASQQTALKREIAADATEHLFREHNGTLVAA